MRGVMHRGAGEPGFASPQIHYENVNAQFVLLSNDYGGLDHNFFP